MKNIYINLLTLLVFFSFFCNDALAQCTGCTITGPTSGNFTFTSNETVCFSSNATLGDVAFQNNSKICVAPGVTLTIQNNVNTSSGQNITFEIGGTLIFNQSISIHANLLANIQSGGVLRAGSGGNNFEFNGQTNTLNNQGTIQVGVLGFQNSNATNIIDNHGTLTINSNINVAGNTTFRNWSLINVGSSFNSSSATKYINCGTFNSNNGYNLNGGTVINTGTFNVTSGQIDIGNNGNLENYGTLYSEGTINGTGTSTFYNEGLAKLNNLQPNGAVIKGPTSNTKLGYIYIKNSINPNGAKVGPNLDFTRYTSYNPDVAAGSGSQGQSQIFNSAPVFVNAAGSTVASAALANVSFACTSCAAPQVTNIGLCANVDGTLPPQANDDTYSITAGSSAATSVLSNDFAVFNGAAATTSNVTLNQVSSTNSGVSVNASGIVSVATSVPAGTYTLVYSICSTASTSSCDNATVTVTVIGGCTNPPATGTPDNYTQIGISDLAGFGNGWPKNVPNGFIAIESKDKGFVITRVANTATIASPIEGMLIYDNSAGCVKLYNGTTWKCLEKNCNVN